MVTTEDLDALAAELLGVFRDHRLVRRTDVEIGSLSLDEAYGVQSRVIAARTGAGERPAGWKVGCTSRAIQGQFGLTEPVRGCLMRPHLHRSGTTLIAAHYLGCAVEPEFVFRIAKTIEPSELADDQLLGSIAAVSAGIEVHNYTFVHGLPTSQELIASNAIHAAQIVSDEGRPAHSVDLAMEGVGLWVNGRLVASGIGAEIMGTGPLDSLRWLARHLDRVGRRVEAGELVIPGSAVGLVHVAAGDSVEARFASLGSCHATFSRH